MLLKKVTINFVNPVSFQKGEPVSKGVKDVFNMNPNDIFFKVTKP